MTETLPDAPLDTATPAPPPAASGAADAGGRAYRFERRTTTTEIIRHRPYPSISGTGQRVVVLAIGANLVMAVAKFVVGILGSSAALIADGWQSLGDTAHTTATLIALRWAAKPADADHRYGHGNVETIASLIVAGILLATGVFVIVGAVQWVIERGTDEPPSLWAAVVAAAALIIKGFLATFTDRAAKAAGSPLLRAAAADHRQDMLASALIVLAIVAANLGMPWLDPLAAFGVGVFIIAMTIATMRESLHILLAGVPLDARIEREIFAVGDALPEVHDMHNLKLHQVGAWTHVTVDIGLDGHMPVVEAHAVATQVADGIAAISPAIGDVHVQIDPWFEGELHDVTRHRPFHIDSPHQRHPPPSAIT